MPLPNKSTASTFDAVNKVNNQSLPPAVQSTDWDNTKLAPAISDVAALGLTAPRFLARIMLATTTAGLSLITWSAMWQNITTTAPVIARNSTGIFTITLPITVSDEYDTNLELSNNITLQLQAANANLESNTFGFVNASANGNVINIYTANASGVANDLSGSSIFVKAY